MASRGASVRPPARVLAQHQPGIAVAHQANALRSYDLISLTAVRRDPVWCGETMPWLSIPDTVCAL